MNILELFSGTKSFSKVAEERGHNVFTIDINSKANPDLVKDIMDLEIKDIPFKPDIIWASPPCTEYSHAKRTGIRKIEEANKIVIKTKEIIEQLNPKIWFIENPQTGLLKNQPILNKFPEYQLDYKDISYCKYGKPYRKQTRIWTNLSRWKPRPICNKDCKFMTKDKKRHLHNIGNARKKYTEKTYKLEEKYEIPSELCLEIIKCCEGVNPQSNETEVEK